MVCVGVWDDGRFGLVVLVLVWFVSVSDVCLVGLVMFVWLDDS